VAQQQAALAVAQKYQKDQGRAFARRLAKDEQRAIPLRTAAIRIMADHLQVTNSQQLLDLMRLSAHENQQIAQAAHQALQQRRNSDAILAQYGVGASARAAERGAARLVAISEQRNQEINALLNGEPSPRTKKNSEDPLEAMASRLRTGAANERLMAAYDIGQLGDPRGVPVVVPALADQDPGVRRVALRSLRHLAEKRRPTPADIIPLFKEKDFLVRATAARAFAQLNIDDPDGVLLAQYADEHQEVVRIALLEALGALGGPDRLRVIDAAAGNPDRSRAERQAALLALTMKKCHAGATAETVLQFLVADDKEFAGLVHQALVQEFGDDYGTGYDGREAWQAVIAGKEPPVIQQQP
jgi:HEAT repeat protein